MSNRSFRDEHRVLSDKTDERCPSVGFSLAQSLYFSLTLVAVVEVFLGVGALTSQMANTCRQDASIRPPPLGNAADVRLEGAPLVRRLSARSLINGVPSTG